MEVIDAINRTIWILGGIGAAVAVAGWLIRRFNHAGDSGR
jgi:hypothetical protein